MGKPAMTGVREILSVDDMLILLRKRIVKQEWGAAATTARAISECCILAIDEMQKQNTTKAASKR